MQRFHAALAAPVGHDVKSNHRSGAASGEFLAIKQGVAIEDSMEKIGNNKVRGDSGYELYLRYHYAWYYIKNGRSSKIPVEMLTGEFEWEVGISAIKQWDTPSGKVPVTNEEKAHISNDVHDVLKFLGMSGELV